MLILMRIFNLFCQWIFAPINNMIKRAEDPEKMLEQAVLDMQEEFQQLRQVVASGIANQRYCQKRYDRAIRDEVAYQNRVQLAFDRCDAILGLEYLARRVHYTNQVANLKILLDLQRADNNLLQLILSELETEISVARIRKNLLCYRSHIAITELQFGEALARHNANPVDSISKGKI
jgi:phage shock protein A